MAYDDYSVGASSIRTSTPSAKYNNPNQSTEKQNSTFAQRTQGSVFNQSPAFLQLTMSTRMQGIPSDNTRVAINPPKQSAPAGNMLNGKFTDLTMQGRTDKGAITNPNAPALEKDNNIKNIKTDDQKLTEALGMDTKNIMFAAA